MSPNMLVLGSVGVMLLAIVYVRIPIGLLLALLGFAGYALLDGFANAVIMLGNEIWGTFSNTGLTVIPLFIFMGQVCYHSGLSGRLFRAAAAWTGHWRGGVAGAAMAACGAFSAICGSNTATAATMSVVALPEMRRFGYAPSFAAGVLAAGTTLGAVIPPSVVAIVLGIQTGLSVRKLFVGGILPGLLLLFLFLLTIAVTARSKPRLAPAGERVSMAGRLAALPGVVEACVLFALVVGGLGAGMFTPTEAGAAGSFFALAIAVFRRSLTLPALGRAGLDSMFTAAMIFLLMAGAGCYGKFLALSRVPFAVAHAAGQADLPPGVLLTLIFFIFLAGGMIMDALALLLIAIPVLYPLIQSMGCDPVWFCLVLLVITTLGAITPPVGASAYVVASVGRLPPGTVFRASIIFLPAFLCCLAAMALFPQMVLWLPDMCN